MCAALAFDIALCESYNVSIPDFLGCSPLSTTLLNSASSSSSSPFTTSLLASSSSGGSSAAPSATLTTSLTVATASTVTGSIVPALTLASGGPVANFTGAALLTGSCTIPRIASASANLTGTTGGAVEFPWVGCSAEQPGCCPFNLMQVGPLSICPQDYFTTAGGCCPSGWAVYTFTLAGQTPCVTTPAVALNPPSSPTATATANANANASVSQITDQLFTLRYTLAPPSHTDSLPFTILAVCLSLAFLILIVLVIHTRCRTARAARGAGPLSNQSGNVANHRSSIYGAANGGRPVLETMSSYVSELPSPPPGSPNLYPVQQQQQQQPKSMAEVIANGGGAVGGGSGGESSMQGGGGGQRKDGAWSPTHTMTSMTSSPGSPRPRSERSLRWGPNGVLPGVVVSPLDQAGMPLPSGVQNFELGELEGDTHILEHHPAFQGQAQ
ncbi:Mucin-21 [Agyrium rufum]|nr:Mucin-21 [Agyrium rufum]